MRNRKKPHYLLTGKGGVFVHPNYERVVAIKSRYLRDSSNIVKCTCAEEALDRAFEHLHLIAGETHALPPMLAVDQMVLIRKLPLKIPKAGKVQND